MLLFNTALQFVARKHCAAGSLLSAWKSQGENGYQFGASAAASSIGNRKFIHSTIRPVPSFGFLLDIDGVVSRGREILPGVKEAFQDLTDGRGRFHVPTVFVTNAGNMKRADKAEKLSEMLDVPIDEEQVIMSHSPLRMFTQYHDRRVLVCGQGKTREIAATLGFSKVVTIDDVRDAFPGLDCVDHMRRRPDPCAFTEFFPNIEAVILFGEPTRWETSLQLLADVLMTNGSPTMAVKRGDIPYPHVPVLACNIDFLWMSDTAALPRFAHGSFLLCLESLYKKLTGYELQYSAVMGKPSQLTYHHAEWVIKNEATKIGIPSPTTIYAVGDNPEADVLGANIFHQYLTQRNVRKATKRKTQQQHQTAYQEFSGIMGGHPERSRFPGSTSLRDSDDDDDTTKAVNTAEQWLGDHGVEHCYSILVETGVYSSQCQMTGVIPSSHLSDFCNSSLLKTPTFVESDLLSGIRMVFEREDYYFPEND